MNNPMTAHPESVRGVLAEMRAWARDTQATDFLDFADRIEAAAALSAQGDAPLSMSMFATRADYDAALAAHGKGND